MRRLAMLIALPLLAVLPGCGQGNEPASKPSPSVAGVFQMTGSFTLGPGDFLWNPGVCGGSGGYDDLVEGAQVVVSDEAGKTVALGSIVDSEPEVDPGTAGSSGVCRLTLRVLNVPAGHRFYGVEVSHRGVVQYTEAEARKPLDLKIG